MEEKELPNYTKEGVVKLKFNSRDELLEIYKASKGYGEEFNKIPRGDFDPNKMITNYNDLVSNINV